MRWLISQLDLGWLGTALVFTVAGMQLARITGEVDPATVRLLQALALILGLCLIFPIVRKDSASVSPS